MKSRKYKMLLLIISIVLIVGAAALYWFVFAKPNPPLPENQVHIGQATFTVELATSSIAQARGLSYRTSLADGHGMLFVFSSSSVKYFWMKDMNFPIDMIWIGKGSAPGKDEQVLGFAENAVTQSGDPLWKLKIYTSPPYVDEVLEVNAGTVAKYGIKVGDPVEIDVE